MNVYYMLECGYGWCWYATTPDGDPIGKSVVAFPSLAEAQENFSLVWSAEYKDVQQAIS